MPQSPTLSTTNFTESQACGACHENHYAEWKTSMHAYAITDPVFRALVLTRKADLAGTEDQFCMQCHTPLGTRSGQVSDNFNFDDLDAIAKDGVSCETCHKTTEVVRPYNNGHVIDEFGAMRGPIEDPVPAGFHASEPSDHLGKSNFCGACHDVIEVSGLNLERPYAEWLESPGAANYKSCQSCHMPTYQGRASVQPSETPERELHRHSFTGVDIPLVDGILTDEEIAAQKERIRTLLTDVARLTLDVERNAVAAGEQIDLYVNVENLLDSHNLPTGTTFIRQMWVEVIATDASAEQLAHAAAHPQVTYHCTPAENAPMIDAGSIDLVTVAAGVHWFDRPAFYREVRRVAHPKGLLAVWTYGPQAHVSPEVDSVITHLVDDIVGPDWPPQMTLMRALYAALDFPFDTIEVGEFACTAKWSLDDVCGVLRTWSGVIRHAARTHHDAIETIRPLLAAAWPRPDGGPVDVTIPLGMRVGLVHGGLPPIRGA